MIDKYVVNANKGKLYFAVLLIIKKRLIRYGIMLFYRVLDKSYHFIADRYSKSNCAIKIGNKRTHYFNYNKGVR